MPKLPFFQIYPLDWLADTVVLSNEAKGAYIDVLCQLWLSKTPGKRDWSRPEFANMLRLPGLNSGGSQVVESGNLVVELGAVCEIRFKNDRVFVCSDRMVRDWDELCRRNDKYKRYNKKRSEPPHNHHETTDRSQKSEVRSQILEEEEKNKKKNRVGFASVYSLEFQKAWQINGFGSKRKALEAWQKQCCESIKDHRDLVINGLTVEAAWRKQAEEYKRDYDHDFFIPPWTHLSTWINQARWEQTLRPIPEVKLTGALHTPQEWAKIIEQKEREKGNGVSRGNRS